MICKACKNEIPPGSVFCMYCGQKLVKDKKKEISVPKPKQLPSGSWFAEMMVKGETYTICEPTEAKYYAAARAKKAGLIEARKQEHPCTLAQASADYIAERRATISPSTLRGYEKIQKLRFKAYQKQDIRKINYQMMINDESAAGASAKTIKNAWGFVRSAIRRKGVTPPDDITMPQVVKKELPWLEPEQIPAFLQAIKGTPVELCALFGLHGLRRSEIYALTPADIYDDIIHVIGAVVAGSDGKAVSKETNKNVTSQREVDIQIPRLRTLLAAHTGPADQPYITAHLNSTYFQINKICEKAGLPKVGMHGLRRTYASLCYSVGVSALAAMEQAGWSDEQTMNQKYKRLAKADRKKQLEKLGKFFENLENSERNSEQNSEPVAAQSL